VKNLVLQGRLAEFGPPSLLLNSNGIFAAMAQAAGITDMHEQ
jgi:ABC-type multidrug transport system fused ATPase/permease subunit